MPTDSFEDQTLFNENFPIPVGLSRHRNCVKQLYEPKLPFLKVPKE